MRQTRQRLLDALAAAHLIHDAIQSQTLRGYLADPWFRSAVQFQLAIIGEALNQARRSEPELALTFREVSDWIALRNVVIHVYDGIDHDLIWTTITTEIPDLMETLQRMLAAYGAEDDR